MIEGKIIGDDKLLAKLQKVSPNIRSALDKTIAQLCLKLSARVKAKLSGEVLKNKTGRLRRSINYRMTGEGTSNVAGFVGTNVWYGRIHEYGFKGDVNVKAHVRRSKAQMKQAVLGKSGRETAKSKAKWKGQGEVMVGAHVRHVDLPAKSFLRSAYEEMEKDIKVEIEKAVKSAARDAFK